MFRKAAVSAPAAPRRGLLDVLTLKAHALAERQEWVPEAFADEGPVDPADARALRREWVRQFRVWAAYSPEQVFALKAGALMLGAAILVLLLLVAVL